jgi:hypothetical protein
MSQNLSLKRLAKLKRRKAKRRVSSPNKRNLLLRSH